MAIMITLVATVGVVVALISSLKTEDKRPIQKLAIIGAIVAIVFIWGQYINQRYESAQEETRYQKELALAESHQKELKEMLDPLLVLAKAMNPTLDDKAAIASLLNNFEESIKWSQTQKRASMLGITLPGGPAYDPNLVETFSSLLDHKDPAVKSAAETCLKVMGSPKALQALEEHNKK